MTDDPEITLRLPLSSVVTVVAALSAGRYCDVAELIADIQRQGLAQLELPAVAPASVPAEPIGPTGNAPTLN